MFRFIWAVVFLAYVLRSSEQKKVSFDFDISPIHTFVNISSLLLKNTLRFLISAEIFTKVCIGDIYLIY